MIHYTKHLFFLLIITCIVNTLSAQVSDDNNTDKFITDQITLSGLIDNPRILNIDSLKAMKVSEVKNINIICQSGDVKKKIHTIKGVLLKDVITAAGVQINNKKEKGAYYIVVTASDNYKAIFAYNELMFSKTGDNTYIVFEENKKPIENDGNFIIMCTSDIVTGPRHVKWVKSIEVKKTD